MADTKAYLYLEDGTTLEGIGFGAGKIRSGEVVFTTAMNGYPETLTDPSYKGQILIITHPLIGNYGVPEKIVNKGILANFESEKIKAEGLIISELTNGGKWNSKKTLDQWMKEDDVPGIYGIDTRALTKKVREHGVMMGVLSSGSQVPDYKKYFQSQYASTHFMDQVSPQSPIEHKFGEKTVVVVDFGVKHGILYNVANLGYNLIRVPYSYSADKIMAYNPVGIVYSNGPGNPNLLTKEAKNFRELMEYKVPTLAICLGHQLAALALGQQVSKMKFGHRAINKAVVDVKSQRSYITTHNHGYSIYPKQIPQDAEIWFMSPDDDVVEGMISKKYNLITTQYHPEARPGTNDALFVFEMFDKMIKNGGI